jgi:ATP sulfurylase
MDAELKIGKSAGGEMHLAAAVYCKVCHMMVELGTQDCPHAIELHRELSDARISRKET